MAVLFDVRKFLKVKSLKQDYNVCSHYEYLIGMV